MRKLLWKMDPRRECNVYGTIYGMDDKWTHIICPQYIYHLFVRQSKFHQTIPLNTLPAKYRRNVLSLSHVYSTVYMYKNTSHPKGLRHLVAKKSNITYIEQNLRLNNVIRVIHYLRFNWIKEYSILLFSTFWVSKEDWWAIVLRKVAHWDIFCPTLLWRV